MTPSPEAAARRATGALFALAAFGTWGLVPVYFRALGAVRPWEILAHRVAWSAAFLLVAAAASGRMGPVIAALRRPRIVAALAGTAVLISANWLTFLWAVERREVLQVSLGYFINPLVNVALGAAFLRERLTRLQGAAVALAGASVLFLAVASGTTPGVALLLAITFGLYGLFRKLLPVDPLTGLLVETLLLLPAAVAAFVLLGTAGHAFLGFGEHGRRVDALLILAGAVTAVPLLCFVAAARRLTLTEVGFFQYLAPSLQFALAVFLWHEPFDPRKLAAFCGIWAALALVSTDAILRHRRARLARRGGGIPGSGS